MKQLSENWFPKVLWLSLLLPRLVGCISCSFDRQSHRRQSLSFFFLHLINESVNQTSSPSSTFVVNDCAQWVHTDLGFVTCYICILHIQHIRLRTVSSRWVRCCHLSYTEPLFPRIAGPTSYDKAIPELKSRPVYSSTCEINQRVWRWRRKSKGEKREEKKLGENKTFGSTKS